MIVWFPLANTALPFCSVFGLDWPLLWPRVGLRGGDDGQPDQLAAQRALLRQRQQARRHRWYVVCWHRSDGPLCAVLHRLPKAHLPSVANATHPPLQTRMWTPSSLATSGRTTAFCHRAPSSSKTGTSSWCAEAPSFPCPEPPPYALPLIAHEACRGFFRAGRLRARWPCDFFLGQPSRRAPGLAR